VVYDKEKREARCYREPVNEWIAALKKRLYEKRGPILEPWWRKPAYYVRSYAARIKRKRAA
jgi:hypothetical protein